MFYSYLTSWHKQYYIDALGLIKQDKHTNMTIGKEYKHLLHENGQLNS